MSRRLHEAADERASRRRRAIFYADEPTTEAAWLLRRYLKCCASLLIDQIATMSAAEVDPRVVLMLKEARALVAATHDIYGWGDAGEPPPHDGLGGGGAP